MPACADRSHDRSQSRESNRARSSPSRPIASDLIHEFRNLLTRITGNADLALMQIDTAHPLHETLTHINHAAYRACDVARQLLDCCPPRTVEPKSSVEPETVLLLEDCSLTGAVSCQALRSLGHEVLYAQSHPEGVRLLEKLERPIALLIISADLPGLDVREMVRLARPRNPGLKMLFLLAEPEVATVDLGLPISALNCLDKPYTPDALASKVREILDR